jgi:hypothetical protein
MDTAKRSANGSQIVQPRVESATHCGAMRDSQPTWLGVKGLLVVMQSFLSPIPSTPSALAVTRGGGVRGPDDEVGSRVPADDRGAPKDVQDHLGRRDAKAPRRRQEVTSQAEPTGCVLPASAVSRSRWPSQRPCRRARRQRVRALRDGVAPCHGELPRPVIGGAPAGAGVASGISASRRDHPFTVGGGRIEGRHPSLHRNWVQGLRERERLLGPPPGLLARAVDLGGRGSTPL